MRVIILFLIMSLVICAQAFAHPPSRVELFYDLPTKMLKMEIYHFTRNVKRHHIRTVVISKNGEKIDTLYYSKQSQNNMHVVEKEINAVVGDRVEIKAYCSEGGTIEKSIVVEKEAPKSE